MKFVFVLLSFVFASCNQNMEKVSSGETLENSPMPVVTNQNPAPFATAAGAPSGEEEKIPPIAKAFFMHTWVEALYSLPKNKNPKQSWVSPLKDPENNRVWCTDCHTSGTVDFTRIPKMRMPVVDELENDKEFMVDLMKKWVGRLNSDEFKAKAKLKGPVTCLTCHETNPETTS
jgi:hypothetical protein